MTSTRFNIQSTSSDIASVFLETIPFWGGGREGGMEGGGMGRTNRHFKVTNDQNIANSFTVREIGSNQTWISPINRRWMSQLEKEIK